MTPRILTVIILLFLPALHGASTKQYSRPALKPDSPAHEVERAIADSLQDLLNDATSFFEQRGAHSVHSILHMPVTEHGATPGTISRSTLVTMTARFQEQASATTRDLSTVMRGCQERMARPGIAGEMRERYQKIVDEARRLNSAVDAYLSHFKQATRGDIGQWMSYDLPPEQRDSRGISGTSPSPKRGPSQTVSGFLVY